MNQFEKYNLDGRIIKALDILKYREPMAVQERVIPYVLNGKDLVVKSRTGSGKTAAFGIPLCERIDWDENSPQALVLTPTRELAVQVKEDVGNIGRFKRIKVTAVFGKQPFTMQLRELKQRTHVVVGTPGRVLDHLERGTLKVDKIKYLVIDEADEMLNMGFIETVEQIINELPKDRCTMLFSATFPVDIRNLCTKHMNNPVDIHVETVDKIEEVIDQYFLTCKEEDKLKLVNALMVTENPTACIMFCRTKENVDKLFDFMCTKDCSCGKIHGGMLQQERLDVMQAFRRGEFTYLAATDVAARGIDIEDVTLIINYDIPMEKERYVHRTGRTGRAGKGGKAITLVTPYEGQFLREIENYIGYSLKEGHFPEADEVEAGADAFAKTQIDAVDRKKDRGEDLNKGISKIYIGGGKKKKLRAGDIVGAICQVEGVTAEDIGIISILDYVSYVEILNNKGEAVVRTLRKSKIKGKEMKVELAK